MKNIDKLVLGTAQLGMDYGINNLSGQVTDNELVKILDVCREKSINYFDTAFDYGNSEERLGGYFYRHKEYIPQIITKYSRDSISLMNECQESMNRLHTNSLYAYLIHNLNLYMENPQMTEELQLLKEKGLVKKTGFSLYGLDELEYLLEHRVQFDLVQFPYNVFDRRFEKYFTRLKELGKEIFVRSVFLQGLFFMNMEHLPQKMRTLAPYLKRMQNFSARKGISLRGLCLNYVCSNPMIDGVLIGVDSVSQLLDNIKSMETEYVDNDCMEFINSIHLNDEKMIIPINW